MINGASSGTAAVLATVTLLLPQRPRSRATPLAGGGDPYRCSLVRQLSFVGHLGYATFG